MLPSRPSRVLVAGTSGSGKSTLARAVAAALGSPYTELDALHHGPGWSRRPEFADDVARLVAGPAWVTEWQYADVRELLLDRADCLVWLDLPRRLVMRRVIRRTLRRRLRREPLWNGNVEPPLRTILTDPEHIVRWAWTSHARTAERLAVVLRERPDLLAVRLQGPAEVDGWLAGPLRAVAEG